MKLLIVTQAVGKDDENLGAFYYWFEKLSRHAETVTIIAGVVGTIDFPSNVTVYSFGKDKGFGRLRRIWKFWELFSYHYARCDAVLFHQISEFILAASPFLIALKRRTVLWYAHGSVSTRVRVAERLIDFVATSNEHGFRLPSKKAVYVGQAINTDLFRPAEPQSLNTASKGLRLITVGRISPVKDYETIIRACAIGKEKWPSPWTLTIVGGPIMPRDHDYLSALKRLVAELNLEAYVHFHGSAGYSEIPEILREHDMFLNMSSTGSLDKAVFEAMASGLIVITSNDAYQSILPAQYFLEHSSPEFLAERVKALSSDPRPSITLREIVKTHHALNATMAKIMILLSDPEPSLTHAGTVTSRATSPL